LNTALMAPCSMERAKARKLMWVLYIVILHDRVILPIW
jgi:hypothetical protein